MLKYLMTCINSVIPQREEGQGTIEYILVLGVLVVGIFGLVVWLGLGEAISGAIEGVTALFDGNPFVE